MNNVIEHIRSAEKVVILAHEHEDADAIGSSFAMRAALAAMGKSAVCCFSDTPERQLEFIGKDYFVFDGNVPECDLCLCLDCGDMERLGTRKAVFDAAKYTVSIDHHETNTFFAQTNMVDAFAPATGEILYELFEKMGVDITKEIAEYLFAAISSDTGSFKYSNVRPRTMEIAAELLRKGVDHAEIARRLYDTVPLEVMHFRGHIMENIEQYCDGKLNIICVPQSLLDRYNISEKDTGDIVNVPRKAAGGEIAVSIRETPEKIRVSFRSNGRCSVSKIAEKFGGGGHAMASGASIKNKTIDEVKAEIIKVCEEVLNG